MDKKGICHMCLGFELEIVDDQEHLCANCYPVYYKHSKRSYENEQAKSYSMQDLKKKWEKKQ